MKNKNGTNYLKKKLLWDEIKHCKDMLDDINADRRLVKDAIKTAEGLLKDLEK